jgi:hypothetical protein
MSKQNESDHSFSLSRFDFNLILFPVDSLISFRSIWTVRCELRELGLWRGMVEEKKKEGKHIKIGRDHLRSRRKESNYDRERNEGNLAKINHVLLN